MVRFSVRTFMVLIVLLALVLIFIRAVIRGREAARAADCMSNLKQFGLALRNYEDRFGCLPPAYMTDPTGAPIHTWRVALLHVFDHSLYGLYDFNVPWNHTNNAGLLAYDTPSSFWWCPSGDGRVTKSTDYVAVIGSQTAWPGNGGLKSSEITDDPASTILLLEVPDSGIHWMEPRDPTLDEILSSGLRSHHSGYVNALFADGYVRHVRTDLSRETMRALLTVNGGERLDPASWYGQAP